MKARTVAQIDIEIDLEALAALDHQWKKMGGDGPEERRKALRDEVVRAKTSGLVTVTDPIMVNAHCDKCLIGLKGFVDDPRDIETKRLSLLMAHRCLPRDEPKIVNIHDSVITGGLHL